MPSYIEKLTKLKPFYDAIYRIFQVVCKVLLIADILITCWIVLARYVRAIPAPNWGEELILTLMAYMAVLSASLAIRRNAHIRMTAFDRYLPEKLICALDLAADLAVMALAIIMLVVGWQFAARIGAKGYYVSMPWLSKFWQYFPIPMAGIAMIFFELERVMADVAAFYGVKLDTELPGAAEEGGAV